MMCNLDGEGIGVLDVHVGDMVTILEEVCITHLFQPLTIIRKMRFQKITNKTIICICNLAN